MSPADDNRSRETAPAPPADGNRLVLGRTVELATRLVREQEQRVASFEAERAPSAKPPRCCLLRRDRDACVLRIANDGAEHPRRSLGLSGMAERAARFQGALSIHSAEGAGFTIIVRLPVSAIARAA